MKTVQEAATLLDVSPRRVRALIQDGFLDANKVAGVWLIDDGSLELRIKQGRKTAGRPRKGSGATETRFLLKNRTHDIAQLVYDTSHKEFTSIGELADTTRAPIGLADKRGRISVTSLNRWWRNRGIPEGRPALLASLLTNEGNIPFELTTKNLGLSLSDQFWICPEESNLEWQDINFFENDFENMLVESAKELSLWHPDNTSDGVLPKHWTIEEGERILLKGSTSLNQEPYNEVIATQLHRRLLSKDDFVPYEIASFDGLTVSSCPVFLSSTEEFVPAYYVMRTEKQKNHHSNYQHYLECCYALGVDDVEEALNTMIVCDDLIANSDRHYRNFGIIRDVETCACRPAPLFDSGTSLWCSAPLEDLKAGRFNYTSKPFKPEASKQLLLVSDFSWFNIDALDGFVDEAIETLSKNALLNERIPFIRIGLQDRVDRICSIASRLQ